MALHILGLDQPWMMCAVGWYESVSGNSFPCLGQLKCLLQWFTTLNASSIMPF